jgi:AcrR family transcriptional regulator
MTTKAAGGPRKLLSRALILEAAFAIVDADDMHELTMSRLGRGLGADPSAVYRHFRNKDELHLAMADVMLHEVNAAYEPVEEPIENLRRFARAIRTTYLLRPGLARAVAARFTGGAAEATGILTMIANVERLGFDRTEAIARVRAIAELTLGHILMTADVLGLTSPQQAFDLEMARSYYSAPFQAAEPMPRAEQLMATRADSDAVFHTMIETFLRGLAAEAAEQPTGGRPASGG